MGTWPDAATARNELRSFLNDGPQDRPVKSKQLVGKADGTNKQFLSWDDRIIGSTFVITFSEVDQSPTLIDPSTDFVLGRIVLTQSPTLNTIVRARYFFQFFLDTELDEALRFAAGEIHETTDITTVQPGLDYSALNFAGYFAFTKQAIRWAHSLSERFLLREAPIEADAQNRPNLFKQIADQYYVTADKMRDSFYMRHGRRHAPSFNVYKPRIPIIGPRR